ncbi:hypothetical protein NRIC_29700 [Enterococcus florum]|uniref:DUF2922 domain-containing protein n=1 Tax=Enterococcus florum TaxID=2480627 RepID=A0A4V0WPU5_9ENTE|nr:DUF2922 domain-containing protein [Enterococcus florum]GCF95079.1 hypothetical protein NRIC_29700 [Enterococcus florum]
MLHLAATFETSQGKKHRWRMKDPDRNKPAEEIREALELLTTLNLFEKDGVDLFNKVVEAKFVETIETPIFDTNQDSVFFWEAGVMSLMDETQETPVAENENTESAPPVHENPEKIHLERVPFERRITESDEPLLPDQEQDNKFTTKSKSSLMRRSRRCLLERLGKREELEILELRQTKSSIVDRLTQSKKRTSSPFAGMLQVTSCQAAPSYF